MWRIIRYLKPIANIFYLKIWTLGMYQFWYGLTLQIFCSSFSVSKRWCGIVLLDMLNTWWRIHRRELHEFPSLKKSSQISFSSGERAKSRGTESESESVQSLYICICDFVEAITGFEERDVFSSLRPGSFMDCSECCSFFSPSSVFFPYLYVYSDALFLARN